MLQFQIDNLQWIREPKEKLKSRRAFFKELEIEILIE